MRAREQVLRWYRAWLRRRIPAAHRVVLDLRRIFIFPTGYGFFFLLIAAVLFVGGINYQNNLVIAFSFLMVSLFVLAVFHTYRNLSGIVLHSGQSEPGFAGGQGQLEIVVATGDRRGHRSIHLRWPGGSGRSVSVDPGKQASCMLSVNLRHRGRVYPDRLKVQTVYPLGLLRAWSLVDLDHHCLAWPTPIPGGACPASGGDEDEGRRSRILGRDDFQGLRAYVPGDSLRLVDWKAFARGQGLNTKLFSDPAEGWRWLDWHNLPGVAPEERLGRLTWWVLELDKRNVSYGLRLPQASLDPAQGPSQQRAALNLLALHGEEES